MHYIQGVQVLHRPGRLREEEGRLGLAEDLLGVLVEKEVALLGVFQHDVHVAFLRNGVPEGDDMGVLNSRVKANLPFNQFQLDIGGDVGQVDLPRGSNTILMA